MALNGVKSLGNFYIEVEVTKEAFIVDPDGEIEYFTLKIKCCLTTS